MTGFEDKPISKAESIVEDIRKAILAGQFAPGERLPLQPELEKKYSVSWHTLQRAIDRLRDDGFIETRGRHGRFVAAQPPHLHRYGLVFPERQHAGSSRFYLTLQQVAASIQENAGLFLETYYHDCGDTRSADYRRLANDVIRHRLAGLIFVTAPRHLDDSPVLAQPGMPRVSITHSMTGMSNIPFDHLSFWHRALEYCRNQGRRRVGLVAFYEPTIWLDIQTCIIESGMETHPYWTVFSTMRGPIVANPIEMMLRLPGNLRPDALIIGDDNFAESAMAAIVASGVRVPQDLEIIVHCNFPNPPPAVLPAKRLGFDCRELLKVCCDLIDRQRRGQSVPPETLLKALWEEELTEHS